MLAGGVVGVIWIARHFMQPSAVQLSGPYVMLGCYLPALYIVLRRPNEGLLPQWLERATASLPPIIRGRGVPSEIARANA